MAPMKSLVIAIGAAALALFSVPASARPFTPEDLVQLRRLGGSTVSPDGTQLVYALGETDLEANASRGDLWKIDLGEPGAAAVRLRSTPEEDEHSPAFSSDGASIYYLSDRSGSNQVWRLAPAGSEAVQVTAVDADVSGFSIAPGGGQIALWFDEDRHCAAASCADPPATDPAATVRGYDEGFTRQWENWGDGARSRLVTFALVDGVAAGEGVFVSRGFDGNVPSRPFGGGGEIAWHPAGGSLFFVGRESGRSEPRSTDLDIYVVAADGSAPPHVLTDGNPAADMLPTPSPDGRLLAYVAMAAPGYLSDRQVLHLRDLATGETRALTSRWDRSIGSIAWSPDMRYLWLTARVGLDLALFRMTLAEGAITRFSDDGSIGSAAPQADGSVLVTMASALAPSDLYRIGADRSVTRLTDVNGDLLEDIDMPTRETFSFAGAGRNPIAGQIFRPPGMEPGMRAPVALWVHGGPQGSYGDSWSYRWNPAAMAARGYAVVTIDFHGSVGYGQRFTDSIVNDWGGKPLRDLQLGLAAALEANDWMDGERVCALGASYGGYMMNWIAGNWPERFSCLVNHAGIFDLRSFYYSTDELFSPEHDFGGAYDERSEAYERWNPVNHLAGWRTPMLVIHGERDFRIPYTQSLSTFTALQSRGIASRLLVFPDEGHRIVLPRNSLRWHREVYDWLDKWLGGGTIAGDMD